MIQDNNYSHASDVWAFAVLAWELYTAFATGQEHRDYSIPYHSHAAEEVCSLKKLRLDVIMTIIKIATYDARSSQ